MTVTKTAKLDMIGFDVGDDPALQGTLAIRWAKLTYYDGELIAREPHRTTILAGQNIDDVMAAVNGDLAVMGFSIEGTASIDLVKAAADQVWTPEILSAAEEKRDAEAADAEQALADAEADTKAQASVQKQMIDAAVADAISAQKAQGDIAVSKG